MSDDTVAAVRGFNRFYTRLIGVLDEGLLETPYSLTEARVLYELAHQPQLDVADLRRALDVDSGYLSRILGRFTDSGLVRRRPSAQDARRQVIGLTAKGRKEFARLDAGTITQISGLVAGLDDAQRRRLTGAMDAVRGLLEDQPRPASFVLRPLGPGDVGWVVSRHGALYAKEYGWDDTFEALVARILADYLERREPRQETGWIAEVDGVPMGSVFCLRKDDRTAQLRLLLVEPAARGLGIGGRLVDECLRFAARVGYAEIMLWTNDVLVDARRIYERAGFTLESEGPHHSFGADLVEQVWRRPLDELN